MLERGVSVNDAPPFFVGNVVGNLKFILLLCQMVYIHNKLNNTNNKKGVNNEEQLHPVRLGYEALAS